MIRRIKKTVRILGAMPGYYSGHTLSTLRGTASILMYHRVLPASERERHFVQPGMYVAPEVFERQMLFLQEHFQILSLRELIERWRERTWDPSARVCVITFDDGWLDNYRYAYPVLRKLIIPATIFLPTDLIGTNDWFWQDKLGYLLRRIAIEGISRDKQKKLAVLSMRCPIFNNKTEDLVEKTDLLIEELKGFHQEEIKALVERISMITECQIPLERVLLDWNEITEMSHGGVSFGSHSKTHKILIRLKRDEIEKEIWGSLDTLSEKKINYVPIFCYPNGDYNQEIVSILKAAGYEAAVGTRAGPEYNQPGDQYVLRRTGIHNDMTETEQLFVSLLARYTRP